MNRGTLFAAVWLLCVASLCPAKEPLSKNALLRGDYRNSLQRFSQEKQGRVAFLGGSITEMNGYRPRMERHLQERFKETKFQFVNAGIASTCSTTGAFRLAEDVFGAGRVDLLFVEFAVNDDQDARHSRRDAVRGMEGVIRQARQLNPKIDIVVVHFVNPGMLKQTQEGKTPLPVEAHERVAKHYQVSSVYLAQELADQIAAKTMTWAQYGGTHPKTPGNRLAADLCIQLLSHAWEEARGKSTMPHSLPENRVDTGAYAGGHWVRPSAEIASNGWQLTKPNWKKLPGQCRKRFLQETLLVADKPGSQTVLTFQGKAVGAYVLAGPDCGQISASIDGGPWRTFELYHRFSKGLHYPRTVMFFTDLESGSHRLALRIAEEKNSNSKGHAVRILRFAVNQ